MDKLSTIKYRGYCEQTKSWVIGCLIHGFGNDNTLIENQAYIMPICNFVDIQPDKGYTDENLGALMGRFFEVLPHTVGAFYKTLRTFNGEETIDIYEGDCVLVYRDCDEDEDGIPYLVTVRDVKGDNNDLFGSSVCKRILDGNIYEL